MPFRLGVGGGWSGMRRHWLALVYINWLSTLTESGVLEARNKAKRFGILACPMIRMGMGFTTVKGECRSSREAEVKRTNMGRLWFGHDIVFE